MQQLTVIQAICFVDKSNIFLSEAVFKSPNNELSVMNDNDFLFLKLSVTNMLLSVVLYCLIVCSLTVRA